MQITAVSLQNVRRFVEPVQIAGLGAGLNVLTAPNESGKSTFFDALHAVFFQGHRSWDKEIKKLVPRVGGDPEVSVQFRADGTNWTLAKCWSSSPSRKDAKLWRDGVLVAQKAEAEEMLAGLIKAPSDGGPAGLLWVRQGVTNLQEKGDEQLARRDIMTSVAGEVEAMTGGRRMEAALSKCTDFLNQHLTGTGKPKATGGLKTAMDVVQDLTQRCATEAEQVRAMQDYLDRRRQVRRELEELTSEAAARGRQEQLERARADDKAAQAYDQKLQVVQGRVAELTALSEKGAAQVTALQEAVKDRRAASDRAAQAATDLATAQADSDAARDALGTIRADHAAQAAAADKAGATLRQALAAERALAAGTHRLALTDRLRRAEALVLQGDGLTAGIAKCLPAGKLAALESLSADLSLARRTTEASAAAFSVIYAGGASGRVLRDGQPVAGEQRHAVPEGAVLDLEGIGRLEIHPARDRGTETLAQAERALAMALQEAGQKDMDAARSSDAARVALETELTEVRADLKAVAPKGVAALRQELAGLPELPDHADDLPDVPDAEAADRAARQARDDLAEKLEAARTLDQTHREALTRAETVLQQAREWEQRAQKALASEPDPEARMATLTGEATQRAASLAEARTTLDILRRDAPDLAAARAALKRAESVQERDDQRINQLREERASLDTRISVLSTAAPEEELALHQDQLQEAQARLRTIEFEIAVYQRLLNALRSAQDQSRERYVAAVHRELVPLLRMIWPDAEPQIDAETGLITAITRRAVEEDFDILSGGTQEQISLLVRLAFARIIAADGRPAPVVLDDAIIYTDDDRIEQMFNALTRQSEDLQIIVFSCRQRAFRSLGGRALTIAEVSGT